MKIVKIFVAKRVDEIVRKVLCFAGIEEMYQEHLRRYVEELSVRNTLINLVICSQLFHARSHHCRDSLVS